MSKVKFTQEQVDAVIEWMTKKVIVRKAVRDKFFSEFMPEEEGIEQPVTKILQDRIEAIEKTLSQLATKKVEPMADRIMNDIVKENDVPSFCCWNKSQIHFVGAPLDAEIVSKIKAFLNEQKH